MITPIKKWLTRLVQRVHYYRLCQRRTLKAVRRKGSANVVFFATNLAMWRYQRLYELLATDARFHLTIVIADFETYNAESSRQQTDELADFFRRRGMHFVRISELPRKDVVKALHPDLLFYVQPYRMFGRNACFSYFRRRLIAYYPYGLQNARLVRGYNMKFHNVAWRVYYPTPIHLQTARELSAINASNAVVVGEPHADDFLAPVAHDPWKTRDGRLRIIWAPHFRITPNKRFYRPSFLWTSKLMLDVAQRYADRISIAFKPHPRLFTELCNHPDWGEARARAYYDAWRTMPNTQVEDGEFIDLFKTSDALIHDCGSFTAEYLYTRRPCLFLTRDEKSVRSGLCSFGNRCMDNHYIASTPEEVLQFIEDVLLAGNDKKAEERQRFFDEFLLPPNGNTTAHNTYADLVGSLFGQ